MTCKSIKIPVNSDVSTKSEGDAPTEISEDIKTKAKKLFNQWIAKPGAKLLK